MEELNYVREGCKSDIRYEGIKKVIPKMQKLLKIVEQSLKIIPKNFTRKNDQSWGKNGGKIRKFHEVIHFLLF